MTVDFYVDLFRILFVLTVSAYFAALVWKSKEFWLHVLTIIVVVLLICVVIGRSFLRCAFEILSQKSRLAWDGLKARLDWIERRNSALLRSELALVKKNFHANFLELKRLEEKMDKLKFIIRNLIIDCSCPVTHNFYTEPMVMTCGHVFEVSHTLKMAADRYARMRNVCCICNIESKATANFASRFIKQIVSYARALEKEMESD